MLMKDTRIVYMGTPDFAVESLRRLVEGGYNVVGVVTMPDKPVGRHHNTLQASPVKEYAVSQGIPVLQPERLKDETFLAQLRELRPDLQIVVAFRMLPEVVWSMPPLGTFNLHASLLPQYRGAAPINWAIINGDSETGVTTFLLDQQIDTGCILHQYRVPIGPDENAGDIHDRLMQVGGDLVLQTTDDIIAGNVTPIPQTIHTDKEEPLRPAPKIFKDTCRISWTSHSLQSAHDFVRGLSPYPAAWTELVNGGTRLTIKIFSTVRQFQQHTETVGRVVSNAEGHLCVAFADGWLHITSLQVSGKRRMSSADFLRGFHLEADAHVE